MTRRLTLHDGWPPQLDALLAGVPGDVGPAWYRQQYHCGRLAVMRWGDASGAAGAAPADVWLLVRIEASSAEPGAARTLVIVAAIAEATPPPGGHFGAVMPKLDQLAADNGCTRLRIHTRRPGLIGLLLGSGWQARETVLTRELPELIEEAA